MKKVIHSDFFKSIIKVIHHWTWLLILLLILSHLFVIGKFIDRHNHVVIHNREARQAMAALVIRASQRMNPLDFKEALSFLDNHPPLNKSLNRNFFTLPSLIMLFEILMIGLIIFYFWSKNHFQNLMNSRTQLLATISHDLRTPITRLKLRAQFLTDIEHAEKIIADLDEVDLMISEILSFARHDMAAEKSIKFDLKSLLLSICYSFIDRGYVIEMNLCCASMPFFGRAIAIKRTFINLIENAIKYAGHAQVLLTQTDKSIVIIIEDNGPGVPEEELAQVFQPYYRSTLARYRPGTGLGLTIAYDVIHSHQGTVSLKNRAAGGLHVKVSLPLSREER